MGKHDEEYFNSRPRREKAADEKDVVCAVCGLTFDSHFNLHEGHRLSLYGDVRCCNDCWDGNWDGWNPSAEARLMTILRERGLPVPPRNGKGLLPRD